MSTAKHTPGPWEFDGGSCVYAIQFRKPGKVFTREDGTEAESTDGLIALPYSCAAATAEEVVANHRANARLIAAAPELLEKLTAARRQLPLAAASWNEEPEYKCNVDAVLALIADIDALIAKATAEAA